ncbi:MAG: glycosyltransferase family 4 protein [Actinobacteria bacterium]|nr:glycosyltransferase family 4 protein [Actinomycetota bacterium]
MRHLLVTNDFPPKVGGIQSYLYELWRRLDPGDVHVLTTPHHGSSRFDRAQDFAVSRSREPVLLPHRGMVRRIEELADRHDAELVVLDPLLPIAAVGARLERPYAVVVHGAEVTVPAMVPPVRARMGSILRGARLVIAAGPFPAAEAERVAGCALPTVVIPPGVDTARFDGLDADRRSAARMRYGVHGSGPVIVSVSRLVPRKGMDVLVQASARLATEFPDLSVVIGGSGRDAQRLERLVRDCGAPVQLVGRVADDELAEFVGMGDVFAMCCRNRWFGIEQEGFGIVFLEAAAARVPQLAGASGGSADAVAHGRTGLVVADPASVGAVTGSLRAMLSDPAMRDRFAEASRERAMAEFDYDNLARRLGEALESARIGSSP